MILIADSGATKTSWALFDEDHIKTCETSGFNPYYMDAAILYKILSVELPDSFRQAPVQQIFYYGSGCSTIKNCGIVSDAIREVFRRARIEVQHDLLAAARALLGQGEGIACILGTGANSCAYDGAHIIKNVPSLGYMFGDEGSGAYIGRKFLSAYLKENLSKATTQAFNNTYHYSLEDILSRVYGTGNPSAFMASFTRFMGDHEHHDDIRGIIHSSFIDFFSESVSKYERYRQLKVGFVGSVAYHFRHLLEESASQFGITIGQIAQAPMEGLLKYHKET